MDIKEFNRVLAPQLLESKEEAYRFVAALEAMQIKPDAPQWAKNRIEKLRKESIETAQGLVYTINKVLYDDEAINDSNGA